MTFLTYLALFVAFSILSVLLAPKISTDVGPGDFRPPEPREGEPIPVIFGTVLVSPSITWFGDVDAKRVIKKVKSLAGLVSQDVPLGYDYYAGMQFVLCHGPVDAVLDIFIGEKRVVRTAKYVGDGLATEPTLGWPNNTTPSLPRFYETNPTRVSLNLPELFGGKEEGGGVVGQIDIHWGSLQQGPNDYLSAFWGADIVPQYRYICYVVLRRVNLGKSPSPAPWKFVCVRIPKVLGQPQYATITDEDGNDVANAAECIYEIITDKVWGLGRKASELDLASFQQCAQTLYSEGLGYSGVVYSKSKGWQLISDILQHCDGVVYQDPKTGLIAMKLIRDDYTVGDLVGLDESSCEIEEFTRGSWAEAVNESQVKFTDVARRFAEAAAQAQNLAAIQAMDGEVVSREYPLMGLSTHQQAQSAAERRNRETSVPLNRFRLTTNRIAYGFHPGMPFKITYPEYGISQMVVRVVSVNYGSLTEGMIGVEAIQDVWDLSTRAYASPDDLADLDPCGPLALIVSGYDPADDPAANYGAGYVKLFEAPYWHARTGARAWIALSRRTNRDAYWEPYRSLHGAEREKMADPEFFVPVGLLDAELPKTGVPLTSVEITVSSAGDMESLTGTTFSGMLAGQRLLMIGDEIMSWEQIENLGNGQYRISGIWRGQLDTVPEYHVQSDPVFFYYSASGAASALDLTAPDDLDPYTQVQVWPVYVDLDGLVEDVDFVPGYSVVVAERSDAPYPPGNVQINGSGYESWPATTSGDVTLSWAHRSRTGQTQMVAQDDSVGFSVEGTLTVEVLLNGEVVREWTGLTGTSQTYTYAQRTSDDADATKLVEFRITPVGAGGEIGVARVTPSFTMEA